MPKAKLTSRQLRAIAELVAGNTIADVAAVVRVSERTVFRWLQDPIFSERLRSLRSRSLDDAMLTLQGASSKAVSTLIRNLDARDKWCFASNQAALGILTHALKSRELIEFQKRLERIENQILLGPPERRAQQWRA
jgi:hypothetical protein